MGRHDVSRYRTFFEPSMDIKGEFKQGFGWSLAASMKSKLPDLTTMVEYTDDSDPLNVRQGNPSLQAIHLYNVSANLD